MLNDKERSFCAAIVAMSKNAAVVGEIAADHKEMSKQMRRRFRDFARQVRRFEELAALPSPPPARSETT